MNTSEPELPDFRAPSAARMYDYFLGGKDHFRADREAAEQVMSVYPEARALARANRRFLTRAVWYLAEHGITQYVDFGCGMPTSPAVHEIARQVRPDARVVYVDNDPVVAAHYRSVCNGHQGLTFIECDIRAMQDILNHWQFGRTIDLAAPVAFLCAAVLHFVRDEDQPKDIAAALRWRMVPGSHLVISHAMIDEASKDVLSLIADTNQGPTSPPVPRTAEEIGEFFIGLDLVEPGLVDVSQWRPDEQEETTTVRFLAGVGRKPRDLLGCHGIIPSTYLKGCWSLDLIFGSYNLEYGAIDNGGISRLRRQLGMLADARADVWVLQECRNWLADGARILYLAERLLGMRGFMARANRGPGGDLGVFIRESSGIGVIEHHHEERSPYWHGVALVSAEIDGFGALRLASAHLAPSAPSLRVIEAEAFGLIAEQDVPLIAGGDWNAVPSNDPEPDVEGIHSGKARRKLDSRAAQALEEHMTDVARHLNNTTPTVGHRRAGKLAYRCDRVYTTLPADSITGYEVIHEDYPESDHRPVIATFTLNG